MAAAAGVPTEATLAAPAIRLTSAEHELFAYLLRVREHAQANDVELRVCGGWVRDKLLERASSDVDIALDTMTGQDFAACINAFERAHGRKERAVGVMSANPGQSKHVEVVTMRLDEMGHVDFVTMRRSLSSRANDESEVLGTPAQDARCRDFTINSLFFNLSTQQVEDFTGQGVRDVHDRVLRTPVDAREILLDGPLCALRAVRFASQLDMELHESLRAAIALDEVQEALRLRVSRERVGSAFMRILSAAPTQVARAIGLIDELQLCQAILLPVTAKLSIVQADGRAVPYVDANNGSNSDGHAVWHRSCVCAQEMASLMAATASRNGESTDSADASNTMRLLAAFALPFMGHRIQARDVSMVVYMLRESLKLKNQVARDVDGVVLQHVQLLQTLVHAPDFDRIRVALLLREMRALWEVCRDVALVGELVADSDDGERLQRAEIVARYSAFSLNVETSGLERIWERPPLLSGKEIAQELGVKSGPAIRHMLEQVFVWQLEHPDKTRLDCLEHFRVVSK